MVDKSKALIALGAKIRSIRESKGLSQSDLAKLSDKDRQSIYRLEKGLINPSYIYLLEIANSINIPISELLNFSSNDL